MLAFYLSERRPCKLCLQGRAQNVACYTRFVDHEVEELKQLVRRNIELTKETRDMVDRMHRSGRRSTMLRWAWRIAVFAVLAYSYYTFVWPYVQKVQNAAANIQSTGSQFSDIFKIFGQ
jgi:hypothetical protein